MKGVNQVAGGKFLFNYLAAMRMGVFSLVWAAKTMGIMGHFVGNGLLNDTFWHARVLEE